MHATPISLFATVAADWSYFHLADLPLRPRGHRKGRGHRHRRQGRAHSSSTNRFSDGDRTRVRLKSFHAAVRTKAAARWIDLSLCKRNCGGQVRGGMATKPVLVEFWLTGLNWLWSCECARKLVDRLKTDCICLERRPCEFHFEGGIRGKTMWWQRMVNQEFLRSCGGHYSTVVWKDRAFQCTRVLKVFKRTVCHVTMLHICCHGTGTLSFGSGELFIILTGDKRIWLLSTIYNYVKLKYG